MMKLVWCNLLLVFLICILSEDCFCGNLEDDEKPLIFTVASEKTDGFLRFQRSAKIYNHDITILGMNKPWLGGNMNFPGGAYKINQLKEALKPYKKDINRVVLFSDSYDVIFMASWQTILEKFKKSGARVLFSAESFCWPDSGLKKEYPKVEGNGYKYLNSGMFIGYAANIYEILKSSQLKDDDDDQLFYSKVFLNPEMREKNGIKLDNRAELFQNLNGLTSDVSLEVVEEGSTVLLNKKFNSHPALVHGNGPSKINLNNYGNYLAKAFSDGLCKTCLEQNIVDKDVNNFTILIAFFIEQPTPFLKESLKKIELLNYKKKKLHIFIHNNINYHKPEVEMFINSLQNDEYISVKVLHENDGISEATARELAINRALTKQCDYLFVVDADVHIDNPNTLQELIMFNRTILAPIVTRDKSVWSNFWGAISEKGFYARSADYMTIVNNEIRGIWNVPYLSSIYLMKSSVLQKISYTRADMDPDMAFCEHLRYQNIFMEAINLNYYGHLVNSENFDIKRTRPDFYELFANQKDWEERFLDPQYFESIEESNVPKQPCTDVYWFPLATPEFCESMIDIMEAFGKWSDGSNSDQRLQGGYEAVPTRDIHMNQVGLEQMWLKLLQLYIKPLQEKVFIGYYHDPPRSLMNFVVRYRPDEQPFLRPHHDSSTFTINIALNRVGVDYEGGGCRFLRYNCSIEATKRGWLLMHPGRLTHFHEGLLVTKGTRYIMISFIDP